MIEPPDIDDPDALDELRLLLYAYEQALMRNDRAALDGYFWHDDRVTRYGIADRQHGIAQIRAHRAATPAPAFTRTLQAPRITTFGRDFATVQVEFVRSDTHLRGFQTQVWVRMRAGWKIVAAHVGMIDCDGPRPDLMIPSTAASARV